MTTLATEQVAALTEALEQRTKFYDIESIEKLIPGFRTFDAIYPCDVDNESWAESDRAYYGGFKLFTFNHIDADGDEMPLGVRVTKYASCGWSEETEEIDYDFVDEHYIITDVE
jgi:hypothetical protein